jgi:HAD superfamily hydrolase (TIGR01509 family)
MRLEPLRAVLFDMDGVLIDSRQAWFKVVQQAGLYFRDREVTIAEFEPTFGQGTAADIESFQFNCTVSALNAFYQRGFVRELDSVWINPDAAPTLQVLQRRGLACAVVTNTVSSIALRLLEHAGLAKYFVSFATADRVALSKPAPDLLNLALREVNCSPSSALMVGDSRYDREAAAAAGVFFVGYRQSGDERVESLVDLVSIVASR